MGVIMSHYIVEITIFLTFWRGGLWICS